MAEPKLCLAGVRLESLTVTSFIAITPQLDFQLALKNIERNDAYPVIADLALTQAAYGKTIESINDLIRAEPEVPVSAVTSVQQSPDSGQPREHIY